MEHNNGGPAFPRRGTNSRMGEQEGMTLRDYFAAKAMQTSAAQEYGGMTPDDIAKRSYAMADAMLKARSQP